MDPKFTVDKKPPAALRKEFVLSIFGTLSQIKVVVVDIEQVSFIFMKSRQQNSPEGT